MRAALIPIFVLGCAFSAMSADDQRVNIDALPHKTIELPNGSKAEVINHGDHWWRSVKVAVLSGNDAQDPDVCFEAKYDSIVPPDKLKLFGINIAPTPNDPQRQWASIIVDDKLKRRAQSDYKRGDNIWICGTLKRSYTGRGVDLHAVDILRLPKDTQRYEMRIAALEKKGDFEALIELGQEIYAQTKADVRDLTEFDRLEVLSKRAYEIGLTLKEKSVRADDADAFYALALQWNERDFKRGKYRQLVEKTLKINPDHPQASRDAEKFGLKKFEQAWRTEDEIARIQEERAKAKEVQAKNLQQQEELKRSELARALQQRPELLIRRQTDLRSGDPKTVEQALTVFGEAIQRSPDAGFGKEGIDILANLDAKIAVSSALGLAAKSEVPEVRQRVLEALAIRGVQQEAQAFSVLSAALQAERELTVAKSGVGALVAVSSKDAVDVLIASLGTPDKQIRDEFVDTLKTVTRQNFSSRDEWDNWWKANKSTFNPN
ncbi:MAG TPA: hypothetical protein VEK08_18345 [Planctomycetota bacterium]|nr:hypothetical protein [Planctomycetota bacterium]